MIPIRKPSWISRNEDWIVKYIIVGMLTFVSQGVLKMSSDITDIKVSLSIAKQQLNDRNATIDELKIDVKASRDMITQVEERLATLEAKK
jgi:hypothetical protein